MVSVKYYTDPVCPWSWAAEPSVRKLMVQFGERLRWTFVMGAWHVTWSRARRARGGAGAKLFELAEQWRVRPLERLTGYMWDPVNG
jgi:protein-disulfide isomerase-like protein with CxxC motif